MILNPIIITGGAGGALPPFIATSEITYTTYSEADVVYATITGFNYTGDETAVTIPQYVNETIEVKKINIDALNTGSFGNINSITIPFQVEWVLNVANVNAKINNQIIELNVVNLPDPIDDAFFENTNLVKLTYGNVPSSARGRAFYGANLNCSGIRRLIANLQSLVYSRTTWNGYKYTNTFNKSFSLKTLKLNELTNAQDANYFYTCFENCATFSIYLPKLKTVTRNMFSETSNQPIIRYIYLDVCDAINFGTRSDNSPFYGLTNLTKIYTTAENYDTLKALFDNAPYASYGTDLASKVEIYNGNEPE